jgi:lipopolysaccharide/colanic/teichoic acid biosynthesis glycosyltransferase
LRSIVAFAVICPWAVTAAAAAAATAGGAVLIKQTRHTVFV